MEFCEGWNFIEAPGEDPYVLTFAQVLAVWQAMGLSLDMPSGQIAIYMRRDSVLLVCGYDVLDVRPRAEWRSALAAWRPAHILPNKGG